MLPCSRPGGDSSCAWDRNDPWLLRQELGECDLSRCCAFLFANCSSRSTIGSRPHRALGISATVDVQLDGQKVGTWCKSASPIPFASWWWARPVPRAPRHARAPGRSSAPRVHHVPLADHGSTLCLGARAREKELAGARSRRRRQPVPGFFLYFPSVARRSPALRLFVEAAKALAVRAVK